MRLAQSEGRPHLPEPATPSSAATMAVSPAC